jgi:hypothetical protein
VSAEPTPGAQPADGVVGVAPVSPENRALYEAGKEMLVDSIKSGRDFCQFMITLSTGGIAVYTGLIKLVLPTNANLNPTQGTIALVPALAYLVAAVVFTYAYFPLSGNLALNVPADIERDRATTIAFRNRWSKIGLAIFVLGRLADVLSAFAILTGSYAPAPQH